MRGTPVAYSIAGFARVVACYWAVNDEMSEVLLESELPRYRPLNDVVASVGAVVEVVTL